MSFRIQGGIRFKNEKQKHPVETYKPENAGFVSVKPPAGFSCALKPGSSVHKYGIVATDESGFTISSPICGTVDSITDARVIISASAGNPEAEEADSTKLSGASDIDITSLCAKCDLYGVTDSYTGERVSAMLNAAYTKSERILINCIEEDPTSHTASETVKMFSKELVLGTKVIMKALGVRKAVFVCDDELPEVSSSINEYVYENDRKNIVFAPFKVRYPGNNDRLIINAIYKAEVPMTKTCASVGYPVFSAETVIRLFSALASGYPVTEKTVTVYGTAIKKPVCVTVPLGISFGAILKHLSLNVKGSLVCASGGMMNGIIVNEDEAVTSQTNIISVMNASYQTDGSCIRCARCVAVCPMHLVPFKFHENHLLGKTVSNEKLGLYNCIECGCCSYMCVGKIDLLGEIRAEKYSTPAAVTADTVVFEPIETATPSDEDVITPEEAEETKEAFIPEEAVSEQQEEIPEAEEIAEEPAVEAEPAAKIKEDTADADEIDDTDNVDDIGEIEDIDLSAFADLLDEELDDESENEATEKENNQ